MHRRTFMQIVTGLIGLAPLPVLAATATQHRLIQHCPLAGFDHHDGPELWPYLTVGDSLELIREPHNPHDRHALRVTWLGRKLGYLPKSQNQAAAHLIDQGRSLEARIVGLEKHTNPWRRVAIEVWLVG